MVEVEMVEAVEADVKSAATLSRPEELVGELQTRGWDEPSPNANARRPVVRRQARSVEGPGDEAGDCSAKAKERRESEAMGRVADAATRGR